MYAVFRSGGKQYRAAKGDVLRLEKIEADEGATVEFSEVLLVGEGSDVKVGDPLLSGGKVKGKIVRQGKSRKVSVVKFRRRQNYLRQGSHRQYFTDVEITGISGAGTSKAEPKAQADKAPKKVAKKKAAKKVAKKAAAKRAPAKKAASKKTASKKPTSKKATKKKAAKKSD